VCQGTALEFPPPFTRGVAGGGAGRLLSSAVAAPANDRLAIVVRLTAEGEADAEAVDVLTSQLRDQLLELDVDSVVPITAGEAPPGTRAGEEVVLGSLMVTLAQSPELFKALAGVLQSWLGSRPARSIELQIGGDTLKVSGVSSDEQQRLIQLFVDRHAS
jgi:hypothetical protein